MELHKLNHARLTHLEAGQLIKSSIKDLETAGINPATDPHINSYVNQMITDSALLDNGLLQIKKNQETDQIAHLDRLRDLSLSAFNRQLKVYELSINPAFVTAYKAITIVVKNYKNLATLNYEAESNGIDNLIADFNSPAYAPHIATLNMGAFAASIAEANDDFKALFSKRTTDISFTEVFNIKQIRKDAFANYANYTQYVLSLARVNTGDAYYTNLLNIINQTRKYYSDLLAKREGANIPVPAGE